MWVENGFSKKLFESYPSIENIANTLAESIPSLRNLTARAGVKAAYVGSTARDILINAVSAP